MNKFEKLGILKMDFEDICGMFVKRGVRKSRDEVLSRFIKRFENLVLVLVFCIIVDLEKDFVICKCKSNYLS